MRKPAWLQSILDAFAEHRERVAQARKVKEQMEFEEMQRLYDQLPPEDQERIYKQVEKLAKKNEEKKNNGKRNC